MILRKIQYTIGNISTHLYARFEITLKNRLGEFCVQDTRADILSIKNLYPSLTLTITDELKDVTSRWTPDKSLSFSRFTGKRFVSQSKEFLEKYLTKDLFRYSNGVLLINQALANEISFIAIAEFDRQMLVKPVKSKDASTNQQFEGIALMFGNISNNVVLSYDEFDSLVKYMDTFDYDGFAINLLNLAITVYGLEQLKSNNIVVAPQSSDTVDWTDKPRTIPDFK